MTIQLELNPEQEAQLAGKAARHGMTVKDYLLNLAVRESQTVDYPTGTGRLTVDEFHKMLAEISKGAESLPSLPTSAFSRESFYEDHL